MNIEFFVFALFALVAIGGGLVMVTARNPVYSAMGLLLTMFSIAVFYVLNDAHFVAAVQVLIYAGAVMTLFLFVIMLIGVDRSVEREEVIPFQRPIVIVLSVALLGMVLLAGQAAWITGRGVFSGGEINGTIETISDELFGTWMIPFLSTMFLLTIAAVGTITLAYFASQPRGAAEEGSNAESQTSDSAVRGAE
ncbi:MAG TPA: NADH-quinone oxidoreductase subunit J [Acidimicrobiia bacterium]|nr:NADH-quinone oxidoreductase subunit J [Acidimicrobiia bacterium]